MKKKYIFISLAVIAGVILIGSATAKAEKPKQSTTDDRPSDVKEMNAVIDYLSLWTGNPRQPFNDPNLVNLWDNHLGTSSDFESNPFKNYNPKDGFVGDDRKWYQVKQDYFIKVAKQYRPQFAGNNYTREQFDWTYFFKTWSNENPYVRVQVPMSLNDRLNLSGGEPVGGNDQTAVNQIGNVGSQIAEIGFKIISLFR